jgi:hypothetical protein
MGFASHEDPLVAAKFNKVKPVLETLLKENRTRFERYNGKRYRGLPSMTIFDNTQLSLDYTLESDMNDADAQQAETVKQFKRLLCRDKSFYNLYDLQLRLKAEHEAKLDVSVNISEFDPSGEKRMWRVSITPEICRKSSL